MTEAVVFDIDGTLLQSDEVDGDLFVAAVTKVLDVADVRKDWTTYRNVTDSGILREIMEDLGISARASLFDAVKDEFIAMLAAHIRTHGAFREIPGAVEFVSRLRRSDSYYVAYATGAWRESATLKLRSAGFPVDDVCIATSSDFDDRVSIMRAALSGAPPGIGKVTYFGDGVWDRAAANQLGWKFVAVGRALGGVRDYSLHSDAIGGSGRTL